MKQKRVKLYASESVLEHFYEAIANGSSKILKRVHIPKSDVFYVRAAIEDRSGIRYSLERIEIAMKQEGWKKK